MDEMHTKSVHTAPAVNSRNQSAKQQQDLYTWRFATGLVVRSSPGAYDMLVRLDDTGKEISCRSAADTVSTIIGAKDMTVIMEGSPVIVFLATKSAEFGLVLGAISPVLHGAISEEAGKAFGPIYYQANPESSAALWSEEAYKTPVYDSNNQQKQIANANRPVDTLPGDWGKINDFGVSFGLFGLTAVMRASHMATIEVHHLDDLVRMVSGQYQHFAPYGEHQIYNDGGHITVEIAGSMRQPETLGEDDYVTGDDGIFDYEAQVDETYQDAVYRNNVPQRTLKRRFQAFIGALADGGQIFVANPEEGQETYDRESKHEGLVQAGISAGGRVMLRTAGGISLLRYDRIPVPKKLLEPWDPDGTKVEDSDPFEAKTPFEFSESDPYGRHLELRDATAWRLGKMYQRFDEAEDDWYVPEETDLDTPSDVYDRGTQSREDYQKHDKQIAGVHIEDDGSIVIRDAWGSEIYMRGGNIIISSSGDTMIQPGKSAVILGGDDTIIKARNSVDITASEKDVRIAAKGNFHCYTEEKGILLETASETSGAHKFTEGAEGENAQSAGINLKAEKSRVFLWGEKTQVTAKDQIIIETEERDSGVLNISVGRMLATCRNIFMEASGRAAMLLTGSNAMLAGSVVRIAGDRDVTVTKGTEVLIPLMWLDIGTNPAELILEQAETQDETFREEDDWLGQYKPDEREDMKFTFRTSSQYGTTSAREVEGGSDFRVYQTMWQWMAEQGAEHVPVSLIEWEELLVNDTRPWPGKTKYEGVAWYKLQNENNVDADGLTIVTRQSLSSSSGGFLAKPFSAYQVVD